MDLSYLMMITRDADQEVPPTIAKIIAVVHLIVVVG